MSPIAAILFAFIAASGNAMFAAGQKKAITSGNPFAFIVIASFVCLCLALMAAPIFGSPKYVLTIKSNWPWALLSGFGLFLTYLGFNLLYSHFGASSYILYAVISIITTALIVGAFIFKESFNLYHWAAMATALFTVGLFFIGNKFA